MKIIQITDLHINAENEKVRGEVDVRANFQELISEINTLSFDYLVVSGDLCLSNGDVDTYKWIKKLLDTLSNPYFIISGNHDENQMIADVFNVQLVNDELFYKKKLGNEDVYFLDTSSYTWSKHQMEWLKNELNNDENSNPIIFIHHPPVISGVKYMDKKHPLKNIPESIKFFNQFEDKKFQIFCGHCHAENFVKEGNMNVYVTPSNYFQLRKDVEYVEVEDNNTHYRVIEINEGEIYTKVKALI